MLNSLTAGNRLLSSQKAPPQMFESVLQSSAATTQRNLECSLPNLRISIQILYKKESIKNPNNRHEIWGRYWTQVKIFAEIERLEHDFMMTIYGGTINLPGFFQIQFLETPVLRFALLPYYRRFRNLFCLKTENRTHNLKLYPFTTILKLSFKKDR